MALSKRVRFRVFDRDDFTCQYCGRSAPGVVLHVDHVVARANGGSDDPFNLTTACAGCNLGKGALHTAHATDYLDTFDDCLQAATCDPAFWPEPVL